MNLCDMARRTGLTRQRILQAARKKGLGQYAARRWSFSEADYERIKADHDRWVAAIVAREGKSNADTTPRS